MRWLDVCTQGELDPFRRSLEHQIIGAGAQTEFDHAILSADGVSRAMEQVDGGNAARELFVDIIRLRVDHITDAHHGSAGQAGFIDRAEDGGVAVAIDNTRSHMQPLAFDYQSVRPEFRLEAAYLLNLATG